MIIIALLDTDTLNEMYNLAKTTFDDFASTEIRIEWQEATTTYDEVNNVDIIGTPVPKSKTLNGIFKEEKRNSDVISTGVIDGVPTGKSKIYFSYDNRFLVSDITNLVDGSLKFIVRPNSEMPITYIPQIELTKLEFFMELEEYPLQIRYICNLAIL